MDLCVTFVAVAAIMSFSSKKKERVRPRFLPDALQRGAISWQVVLDDSGQAALVDCYLGISTDTLVLIEERSREIVFVMPCKAILGWSTQTNRYGVICIEIMRFFLSFQVMNFLHLQMYLTFSLAPQPSKKHDILYDRCSFISIISIFPPSFHFNSFLSFP